MDRRAEIIRHLDMVDAVISWDDDDEVLLVVQLLNA